MPTRPPAPGRLLVLRVRRWRAGLARVRVLRVRRWRAGLARVRVLRVRRWRRGAGAGAGAAGQALAGGAGAGAGAAGQALAGGAGAGAGAAGQALAGGAGAAGQANAGAAAGAGSGGGGAGGETISGPVPGDLLDAPEPGAAPSLTEPLEAAPPAQAEQPTVDAPAEGEPDVDTGEIAAAGAGAGQASGGLLGGVGGVAAAALQTVISAVTGRVTGAATDAAGTVGQMAGEQLAQGRTAADESAQATDTEAGGASTEAGAAAGEAHAETRGLVDRALDAVTGVPGKVAGEVQGVIGRILGGSGLLTTLLGPFGAAFNAVLGALPADLETAVRRIGARIGAVITRIDAVAARIAGRIAAALAAVAGFATRLGAAVRSRVAGLAAMVADLVSTLPAPMRAVASAVVSRLTALVQRVVDRIIQTAERIVTRVTGWLTARLRQVEAAVRRVLSGVRRILDSVIAGIVRIIGAIRARVNAVIDWVLGKVRSLIARALRVVLKPLQDRLLARVLALIGPAVQEAVKRGKMMFPNGMPAPPAVEQAAAQAAAQAPPGGSGPGFIDSLMKPEGDHIGVGVVYSGDTAAGAGVGVSAGAMLDVVLDYRRNDIGFFFSPGATLQGSLVDASVTGGVGGAGAWGTVASFGNPGDDVLSSFGGVFVNANYGAQAKLAVGGGAEVQSGGAFYSGIPSGGAPGGAPVPGVPGGTTPGTPGGSSTTPPTPAVAGRTALGDVLFPTGADVPPGGAVEAAAQAAQAIPGQTPGMTVTSIEVVGHTSRGWRHLPPGLTREQANRELGERRGRNVADRLRSLVAPTSTTGSGAGDSVAAAAGKAETDLSPGDQRAAMTALTNRAGSPGTTTPTPGTPGGTGPGTGPTGPAPPTTSRAAWGWDTTVSASALGGEGGALGVYGGVGISYSVPLGKVHMQAETMQRIRTAVGYFKLVADVLSLSPLGFIRDLMGLDVPVAPDATAAIGGAATSWSLPRPA